PFHSLREHHPEERRRVDRPVIGVMRDLAQSCELAATKLVEDLSGLLLGELVDLVSLVAREETQRSPRDVGMPPERLVCRDEAVAAARDGVTGDARHRVRSACCGYGQ